MSFTQDIKEQISRIENQCNFCDVAELSALLKFSTGYQPGEVSVITENEDVANRFCYLFEKVFSKKIYFTNKNGVYKYQPDIDFFISQISVRLMLFDGNIDEVTGLDCCKRAYIRGAFLGGGSVSDPTLRYHLEFDIKHEGYAEQLLRVLEKSGFRAKKTYRKGRYIVYIKDYETIADVLGTTGAVNAVMEIYNASIQKDIRNTVNRRANCEFANIDKVAKTAAQQLSAIRKIQNSMTFEDLPETLKEIAILRINNPECSLKELGEMTNPPIGKSGVNHRLKRLIEIADKI